MSNHQSVMSRRFCSLTDLVMRRQRRMALRLAFILTAASLQGCAALLVPDAPPLRLQPVVGAGDARASSAPDPRRRVHITGVALDRSTSGLGLSDSATSGVAAQTDEAIIARLLSSGRYAVTRGAHPGGSPFMTLGADLVISGVLVELAVEHMRVPGLLSPDGMHFARARLHLKLHDGDDGTLIATLNGTGEANIQAASLRGGGADIVHIVAARAIEAAVSDLQSALFAKIDVRPWRAPVLRHGGHAAVLLSDSDRFAAGDGLAVMRRPEAVRNAGGGFRASPPAPLLGTARVVSVGQTTGGRRLAVLDWPLSADGAVLSGLFAGMPAPAK